MEQPGETRQHSPFTGRGARGVSGPARLIALLVVVAGVVFAFDLALAQTATRTIRIEKVIVDTAGIAPETTFAGTISNASPGTWAVTSSARTVDFVVVQNQEHVIVETAPPDWSGWRLEGYKSVRLEIGCGTSGFNFNTGSNSVPPGDGDRKICVRNRFVGGVLAVGVVLDPASGAPPGPLTLEGGIAQGAAQRTTWSASLGGFSPFIALAAEGFTVTPGSLPGGWSVTGWAAGSVSGTAPSCPASGPSYVAGATRDVTITAGQRAVVCLMLKYTPPAPAMGTLVIGKVRDGAPGVPGDDGTTFGGTFSGPTAGSWEPLGFGQFSGEVTVQAGSYTLSETASGGWQAVGWAAGSLVGSVPSCPANRDAYAGGATATGVAVPAGGSAVVCVMNTREARLPGLAMAQAAAGLSGGWAHWEIRVTNDDTVALDVVLSADGVEHVAHSGGACSETDFGDGTITCAVPANATLTVTVRKAAPAPGCAPATVNASATAVLLPPARATATPFGGTVGGTAETTYTIAADPGACRPATVTKGPLQGPLVDSADDVAWVVTVTNPDLERVLVIRDAGSRVIAAAGGGTHTAQGAVACPGGSDPVEAFEAALNDAGVACTFGAGASMQFTVAPVGGVARGCSPRAYENTVVVQERRAQGGDVEAARATSTITLAGDPAACQRSITIAKAFHGDAVVGQDDYPAFTFAPDPGDGLSFDARCTASAVGSDPVVVRWTCTVPASWTGTVREASPSGWEPCQAGPMPAADFAFVNCRQPTVVVRMVVTNVEDDRTRFGLRLTDTSGASLSGEVAEWGDGGALPAVFENLPVGGSHGLAVTPQFGFRLLGWAMGDDGGTCPSAPPTGLGTGPITVGGLGPGGRALVCLFSERVEPVVVDKWASPATVRPGGSFRWEVAVTITGAALPERLELVDELPAGFVVGPPGGDIAESCQLTGLALRCALDANAPPGTYGLSIPVTVPADDFGVCGEQANTVTFSGGGVDGGSEAASVRVECARGDARILVAKVVRGLPADGRAFTATVTGPGLGGDGVTVPFDQARAGELVGLGARSFVVSEQPAEGYVPAGWAYGAVSGAGVRCPAAPSGVGSSATVALDVLAPEAAVCFYNDPIVTVRAQKTLNVVGFERPGAGWEFTLSGCGRGPRTATTDSGGIVEFAGLPVAVDCTYTVAETVQPGWTPHLVAQTARPARPGEVVTLAFLNIRDFNPPCVDPGDPRCAPPPPPANSPGVGVTLPAANPTATSSPPWAATATPSPAATPPVATASPGPTEQVGGAVIAATPRPPAVGAGGGAGAGGAGLLALAGLLLASAGLGALAVARRRA
jgi:hypothetical protein